MWKIISTAIFILCNNSYSSFHTVKIFNNSPINTLVSGHLVPESTRTCFWSTRTLVNSYLGKKNLFLDQLNFSTHIYRSTSQSMKTLDPFGRRRYILCASRKHTRALKWRRSCLDPISCSQMSCFFFWTVSKHSLWVLVGTVSPKKYNKFSSK